MKADAASARKHLSVAVPGRHRITLSFDELVLIYKSLQAVKTLDALPRQDELLNDTIRLVDEALNAALG